jgi:hypothetical protein
MRGTGWEADDRKGEGGAGLLSQAGSFVCHLLNKSTSIAFYKYPSGVRGWQ